MANKFQIRVFMLCQYNSWADVEERKLLHIGEPRIMKTTQRVFVWYVLHALQKALGDIGMNKTACAHKVHGLLTRKFPMETVNREK